MNRITSSLSLILLFLGVNTNAAQSGFHFGGQVAYANSRIPTTHALTNVSTTTEKGEYAVSGFFSGGSLGYRYSSCGKFYLDASVSALFNNKERTENTAVRSTTTIKVVLDRMVYPMLTAGIHLNEDTSFGVKAGYGQEKWTEKLITDTPIDVESKDTLKQWLLGAELSTVFNDHFLMGLSATYSHPDEYTPIDDTTDSKNSKLTLEPETTVVSLTLHYIHQSESVE